MMCTSKHVSSSGACTSLLYASQLALTVLFAAGVLVMFWLPIKCAHDGAPLATDRVLMGAGPEARPDSLICLRVKSGLHMSLQTIHFRWQYGSDTHTWLQYRCQKKRVIVVHWQAWHWLTDGWLWSLLFGELSSLLASVAKLCYGMALAQQADMSKLT